MKNKKLSEQEQTILYQQALLIIYQHIVVNNFALDNAILLDHAKYFIFSETENMAKIYFKRLNKTQKKKLINLSINECKHLINEPIELLPESLTMLNEILANK